MNYVIFFSVILDTTLDITKKDPLSQIIKYVTIPKHPSGKPIEHMINESLLGFKFIEDQSASGLEGSILDSLQEYGLSLSKCRG